MSPSLIDGLVASGPHSDLAERLVQLVADGISWKTEILATMENGIHREECTGGGFLAEEPSRTFGCPIM